MSDSKPAKRRGLNFESRIVAIPLDCGGYARGVVARHSTNGVILFAYSQYYASIESLASAPMPRPEEHFCAYWTYSRAIFKKEWHTCGKVNPWDRELWRRRDWRAGMFMKDRPQVPYYMTLSDAEGYPMDNQTRVSTKEEHDSCLSSRFVHNTCAVQVSLSNWLCHPRSPFYYQRGLQAPE